MGLYGIKDACNVILQNLSTKSIDAYLDFANTFNVEVKGDTTYATGKGEKRIAFDKPSEVILLGAGAVTTGADVMRREALTVTSGKVTLTKGAPLTGSLTVAVLSSDGVSHDGAALEAGITTPADATEYVISGNVVTVDSTLEGKVLACYYLINSPNSKKFTVKSNGEKSYYKMFADVEVKLDENGQKEYKQMVFYKATPQKNLSFNFDAENPTKFDMTFDALASSGHELFDFIDIE
jgi:autotransporter adhesin